MTDTKWTPGHIITAYGCIKDLKVIDRNETQARYFLSSAAPDLYAATDWVDSKLQTFLPPDMDDLDEVDVTLTYREIRALIDARRKARGE